MGDGNEGTAPQGEGAAVPGDGAAADGRLGRRGGPAAPRGTRGASGERLDAEQDAVRGLRLAAGQVFGGNQYVYNSAPGADALRSYRLSAEELDEVRGAFVEPAGFGRLLGEVRARSFLIVRGPEGAGKEALVRALADRVGHRRIELLDPATELGKVKGEDMKGGTAYVLADLTRRAAADLSAFELRRLDSVLRQNDCRMLITAPATARFADSAVQRDVMDVLDETGRRDVVAAHLMWRIGVAGVARGRRILDRPDVAALLDEELDGETAAKAAALGRSLAEAAMSAGDEGAVAEVRGVMERGGAQALARWMQDLPDLAQQCLAVGVAVFGGEAYETVAPLARDLEERLQVPESVDNPVRRRGVPLAATRSVRLAAIRGSLVESEVSTRYGGARGKVVRFTDPGVAVKVLEHVWSEYDDIREELPTWLRSCAAGGQPTVGVRAAVAAGVLADHAFETVRARILVPWASAEDAELRDAAAVALGVVAQGGHAQAAYNLVLAWSAESAGPELQATAARAWRVVFERDGDERLWAWLHQLAAVEELAVVEALCRSLTEYMALEDGRYRRDALDLLDQWSVSAAHGIHRRRVGELAFLYAAGDLVEPRRAPGAADLAADSEGTGLWPTLLAVTESDPVVRDEVATLWRRTVNSAEVWEVAHDVLTEWAYLVESYPSGRTALAGLLDSAVADRRTGSIIRHLAAAWIRGAEGRGAPITGRTVLAYLERRSDLS